MYIFIYSYDKRFFAFITRTNVVFLLVPLITVYTVLIKNKFNIHVPNPIRVVPKIRITLIDYFLYNR